MYEIIKAVIESGRYELSDMLTKIDTLWIQDDIADDQKTELVALARQHATPKTHTPESSPSLTTCTLTLGI